MTARRRFALANHPIFIRHTGWRGAIRDRPPERSRPYTRKSDMFAPIVIGSIASIIVP
jgi:hypothetical protein